MHRRRVVAASRRMTTRSRASTIELVSSAVLVPFGADRRSLPYGWCCSGRAIAQRLIPAGPDAATAASEGEDGIAAAAASSSPAAPVSSNSLSKCTASARRISEASTMKASPRLHLFLKRLESKSLFSTTLPRLHVPVDASQEIGFYLTAKNLPARCRGLPRLPFRQSTLRHLPVHQPAHHPDESSTVPINGAEVSPPNPCL